MTFEISEIEMWTIQKVGRMIGSLIESLHMRRSWLRYIFVILQGTGLILTCLAVSPPTYGQL